MGLQRILKLNVKEDEMVKLIVFLKKKKPINSKLINPNFSYKSEEKNSEEEITFRKINEVLNYLKIEEIFYNRIYLKSSNFHLRKKTK